MKLKYITPNGLAYLYTLAHEPYKDGIGRKGGEAINNILITLIDTIVGNLDADDLEEFKESIRLNKERDK